jgi:hypothetical protein
LVEDAPEQTFAVSSPVQVFVVPVYEQSLAAPYWQLLVVALLQIFSAAPSQVLVVPASSQLLL